MNPTRRRLRFGWVLMALTVVICLVGFLASRRATAQAANGRIAFTSDNTIYTINPDGSALIKLTPSDNGFLDRYPAWSPDGTKIAFGRGTLQTPSSKIFVMNANGSNATQLTDFAGDRQPSWSPDGTKIAFVSHRDGNDEIY